MDADQDLIAEFVVESQEGLADVETQMLAIEAAGADIDVDLVNAVFRTMHSIKGAAGFLGLDRIGTLAHSLEELLNNLRSREIIPTSELVTTMLRAADFMKGLIDCVETSNDADVSRYVSELQSLRAGSVNEEPEKRSANAGIASVPKNEPQAPALVAADVSQATLSEAVHEFLVECYENLDQMDQDLLALEQDPTSQNVLRSVFRTMHTIKGGAGMLGLGSLERLAHSAEEILGGLRNGERQLNGELSNALLSCVDKCREGLRRVEATGSDAGFDPQPVLQKLISLAAIETTPVAAEETPQPKQIGDVLVDRGKVQKEQIEWARDRQLAGDPLRIGEILVEAGVVKTQDVREAMAAVNETRSTSNAADTSIRVDVGLLDKLMTRVGELVLARNQILRYTNRLDDSTFVGTAQRLNLITTELQESVMKTRMQPIGNVWAKFPRVVRDLSAQLGKQIRIEMEGKETELDKTIVEAIKDPLTHLIRNAVDHGIEKPEVRAVAGKVGEGRLCLRAYHEGGQVNIEISDDGAGLNLDRIRKKAVERGLMTADQANRMSDREAAQVVLLPGFSTAEQVTSVSGRGVGMDVVKTNIERIGGTIDMQSQPGRGTTVRIKIPLTLAIIPALVVTCGGDRYAIPQVSLLELVRLEGEQAKTGIEFVHGAPVFRLRGKLLPLVYLAGRLNLENGNEPTDGIINIVVLRANERQFGLVVDRINDTEEIVVKPLSQQLKGLGEYAGATIMGDGTVALILDVMGLALASGLIDALRDQGVANLHADESKTQRQTETLLVVGLGDSRRFALPISTISRLEKVSKSAIEFADGREVIQYRGAILPLLRLGDVFNANDMSSEEDEITIIVYEDEATHCGLVVHRIIDIVDTTLDIAAEERSDNLLGTAVIQKRVTDVLNLRRLARIDRRPANSYSIST